MLGTDGGSSGRSIRCRRVEVVAVVVVAVCGYGSNGISYY